MQKRNKETLPRPPSLIIQFDISCYVECIVLYITSEKSPVYKKFRIQEPCTRRRRWGSLSDTKQSCHVVHASREGIRFYDASPPSLAGALAGWRSAAGCALASMGEVGLDGGELATLSRSSKLARALYQVRDLRRWLLSG